MIQKEHSIEIVRYTNAFKQQWDRFVDEAKNGTFLFRRDFMEYHKDRFEDYSLMIFVDKKLKAVFPSCIEKDTVFSHKGLTFGGLLVSIHCRYDLYKDLFSELFSFLKENKINRLEIKTLPYIYCQGSNDEIAYLYQFYQAEIKRNIDSVIFLKKDFNISKSIIRNAKMAKKNGITIRKSSDFEQFWNKVLIPRLNERYDKKPVHSLQEILHLKEKFSSEILLIGAFLNNEMIAGTVLFKYKSVLKSQYIGSIGSYNKLGALDLLHLEMIQNASEDYFDFGISVYPETGKPHESLLAWKEQFGARSLCYDSYVFNLN